MMTQTPPEARQIPNPLARFSLQNHVEQVERDAVAQTHILGRLVLLGQATVWFAAANTGKTLLLLHLLSEGVAGGLINPEQVFYANMDDTTSGLLEKLRIAGEYGFHVCANGYQGFSRDTMLATIQQMIVAKTASGTVIVLDTLKKFVDTMDKRAARQFTGLMREFVQAGGTVVALSHTNKKPDVHGRAIYSGTTDIVDDFDCAYLIDRVQQTVDASKQVVLFENIKARGPVAAQAAYAYSKPDGVMSYAQLLGSVAEVEVDEWLPRGPASKDQPEPRIIEAIEQCIRDGVTSKMLLAAAVRKLTNVSRQAAIRVIEQFAVDGDPEQRWTFTRGGRGVHHYSLLPPPPSTA